MKQCEQEFQKTIHLQNLANQLLRTFSNLKRVTKSHTPAKNATIKIVFLEAQPIIGNEIKGQIKYGRPVGSKVKILIQEKKQSVQMTELRKILLKKNSPVGLQIVSFQRELGT